MIIMDSVIPRPPAPPPLPPPFGPLSKSKKNPSVRSKASTCTSPHHHNNMSNGLVNGSSGFITGNGPGSGFRLTDDQGDTGSVYSAYKQRIDAMFESDSSQGTNNSVQAKIEKMFSDVAKDSGVPPVVGGGVLHSFSVDYLGSVPLHEKVTSLSGLQSPLRDLYFAYKKTHKKTLTGRLEISGQGLKVQYQGDKGDLEQLNSFPTIAVWSAVKFVIQEGATARPTYAFLPLITDPDNIDKKMLFRALEEPEKKYINSQAHSPLFAVVMRKIGVHKQLECHGFVCQTSEDAIVIAATLYKSLMAHMKQKEKKPKSRNGITCMSITSSVFNEKSNSITPVRPPRKKRSTTSSTISESDALNISDTQPLLCKKQPRKSTKTRRAPKAPDDFDAILPYEEPIQPPGLKAPPPPPKPPEIKPKTFSDKINTFMSKEQRQITAEIKHVLSEGTNRGLKSICANHSSSAMSSMESQADDQVRKDNTGDILTKVTIPRSGSFLNAGGLTRYKSKVSRSNGQATGGSPLGFNELFNEFRLQEGLHSMDEILGVIIDPEGMSFNDLKPIYKEFLLKLSVTLTKDELYQRSKMIMRRQKKKQMRRNNNSNNNNQSSKTQPNRHRLVGSKFKRLKHIFQKKLRLGRAKAPQAAQESHQKETNKLPESSISTSSYDTRQFTPKNEAPVASSKKQSYKKRRDRTSTSEESDFFSIRRKANKIVSQNQNRNSSSGYVSCSECSYDSDTCTCISADKCYCSLGNSKGVSKDPTYCGCDTDSCTESNKCYCLTATKNHTILEQLKRRGFMPEMHGHTTKHKKLCKRNSNTKSTRSLEYMHNPMEAYYEKLGVPKAPRSMQGGVGGGGGGGGLGGVGGSRRRSCNSDNMALDYELFSIQNVRNRAVYATALGETMHHSRQASMRSYTSSRYGIKDGRTVQQSISAGACTEALSVKKSAEIAALFADIKLSQTTDIAHLGHRNIDMISSRNAYNKLITQNGYGPLRNNSSNGREAAIYSGGHKMVQNALYGGGGRNAAGAKMYSAKNGLYTIQSQSDESRRSSVSDEKRGRDSRDAAGGGGGGGGVRDRDYFDIDGQFQNHNNKSSLENSLGYLP